MYKMTQPGRPEITVPVAAADDDRPQVGGAVHLPAVLRQDRRQLYRRRLEGRRAGSIRAGIATSSPIPRWRCRSAPQTVKARARTATGEERARLWEESLEFWPPYADYQTEDRARRSRSSCLDPVR